jgi:hypothetical protein
LCLRRIEVYSKQEKTSKINRSCKIKEKWLEGKLDKLRGFIRKEIIRLKKIIIGVGKLEVGIENVERLIIKRIGVMENIRERARLIIISCREINFIKFK